MTEIPYKYRNLKLRMLANPSSVVELNPLLTINSITESADFRYNGKDANAVNFPPWGYGETLALQAGTPPTYNDGSPCLGPDDDSVKGNGGGYYKNATAVNQIEAEDFIFELMWKATDAVEDLISTFGTVGYYLYNAGGGDGNVKFYLIDSGGSVSVSSAVSSTPGGTWNHAILAVNRDEASTHGAQWYINGVASGVGVNVSAISGTLLSTAFSMLAAITGGSPTNSNIAYAAMWKRANWLQAGAAGQAEVAAIAAERFALLSGFLPQKAIGTSLATVKTRAFSAYLRKQQGSVIKLEKVGSEWMRMESLNDKNGINVKGYLAEPQITNLLDKSEDFAGWTKLRIVDVVTNDVAVCPDGRIAAASLVASAMDTSHGVSDVATLTAATHTFSIFASPGDKDFVKLENTTVANCWCYFNATTGEVLSSGAGATGYSEGPFLGDADDEYRCSIVFTGTAAVHTLQAQSAHADNDDTFAGDGVTVNTYLWGAQCEPNDKASSPIITAGATATRLKDQLRFKGDDGNITNNGRGTIVMDVLFSDYDISSTKYLFSLNDGGSALDRIPGYVQTNDKAEASSAASGGSGGWVTVNGDIADGEVHEVRLQWETNNLVISRDGVEGTPDTSCDMPNDLDRIEIGQNRGVAGQTQDLIFNLRIYSEPTKRG